MRLVFPVVMHVCNGKILDENAFMKEFGVKLLTLRDLPTEKQNEAGESELEQMEKRVRSFSLPQKLNLVIRPRGQAQVIKE